MRPSDPVSRGLPQESVGREALSPRQHAGMAAILAFTHIALCGYLGYVAFFLLGGASRELLANPKLTVQIFLPLTFALLTSFPTDPLTRTLAHTARAIALAVAVIVIATAVLTGVQLHDPVAATKCFRALLVSGISGAMAALGMSEAVRTAFLHRINVAHIPRFPPYKDVMLALAGMVLVIGVCALSYPSLLDSSASNIPRAIPGLNQPFGIAGPVFAVFVIVVTLPVSLFVAATRGNFSRVLFPLPTYVALAILSGLAWAVVGSTWGARAFGFELFCYATAIALLIICTASRKFFPHSVLPSSEQRES